MKFDSAFYRFRKGEGALLMQHNFAVQDPKRDHIICSNNYHWNTEPFFTVYCF